MSLSIALGRLAHEQEHDGKVTVQFAAGDWSRVKHLFKGSSSSTPVDQDIPEDAAVITTFTAEDWARVKAMATAEPLAEAEQAPIA